MKKLPNINAGTNPITITNVMKWQSGIHRCLMIMMGEPATREERDTVGREVLTALAMQVGTMVSAFYDADTGKDTDGIALGNRLIDAVNQWMDEQTMMN